jgi:hypothetical protein
MAQATDLYHILKAYANKKNSPYINIEEFITFLETYSARKAPEQPEWARWTGETEVKFWSEMSELVESEHCTLMADSAEGRIYMPHLYVDLLREAYHSIDDTADVPFPNEESLRITIPEDQIQILKLESGMGPFFEGPRDSRGIPVSPHETHAQEKKQDPEHPNTLPLIMKLIFPEGYGSALILAPMIPRQLMESALLKIRHYLRTHGNREYVLHKLLPPLQGREKQLREIFDQISVRPLDCLNAMESFGDFAWLFWAHFCALVKNDIKKKKEILTEDLAAIQAVFVIENCNGFYKARAVKQRERETAFRYLELRMEKPPYYYTIEEIRQFTNGKGLPLVGLYSLEELDTYLKKRIAGNENGNSELPDWLIFQGKKSERWYIKKENLFHLCSKLVNETRPLIQNEITQRWIKLIKEFQSEAPMEKDAAFDKLLGASAAALSPVLTALLEDPKLLFVYKEMEHYQKVIPASIRIFKGEKLIPMNVLYNIHRKDILGEARLMLPFWYSIPILVSLIAFFKKLKKRNRAPKKAEEGIALEEEAESGEKDIQNISRNIAREMVPPAQSLDDYLADLETRWSRLLNKQARQNLIEDVNALARDHLRHIMRIHKKKKISRERLDEAAADLISHIPALRSLGAQDSLRLYLELYMVKFLLTFKL